MDENREVSLPMMLECREQRAQTQKDLIEKYGKTLVSFSMNIAGPVKTSYLIERGFLIGQERLLGSLYTYKAKVLFSSFRFPVTGPEGFFVVDLDPLKVKDICIDIENQDQLGRLFDLDVIAPDGTKLERKEERCCLICNKPAKECSSRRLHTVEQLWNKTTSILSKSVLEHDSELAASLAVKALMYEVLTTPKPGLVDRNNTGSHQDMDLFTFSASACTLFSYFQKAYALGFNSTDPQACFTQLRQLGKTAEQAMFCETRGVNTHKGAIFTLGIVCCAVGFTATTKTDIFQVCAEMTRGITQELKDPSGPETNGKLFYTQYGITGIRGEMEDGLPAVKNIGLPLLEKYLAAGKSLEEAGSRVLITLIAEVADTNMIARGGFEYSYLARSKAEDLTSWAFRLSEVEKLDKWFIEKNLSPGGCADLLAVCYFLHFVKERFYV